MTDQNEKETLTSLFNQFSEIFHYPYFIEPFFSYLSSKFPQKKQTCGKELINEGGWLCHTCCKFPNNIICNDCYISGKDKHISHTLEYLNCANGSCDCGNPTMWAASGFCPDHSGPFKSEKEIHTYLLESFHNEETLNLMESQFQSILSYIIINMNNLTTPKRKNLLIKMLLSNLFDLCNENPGILHVLCNFLLKQHNLVLDATTHKCYYINEKENKVETDNNNYESNKKHKCVCCYLTFLLRYITNQEKAKSLLILFQNNYKMRLYSGWIYFMMFPEIVTKEATVLQSFGHIMLQKYELSVALGNNPHNVEWFFNSLEKFVKNYLNMQEYDFLSLLLDDVFSGFLNLMQQDTVTAFARITPLYLKLIDIIILFHNINSFTEEKYFYQREGYNINLVNIEIRLLILFSNFLGFKQFDETETDSTNTILSYLVKIISNQKYKILKNNEYSFHIPLYRIFSLYLTRFTFSVCLHNDIDFITALQQIVHKYIPNYDKMFILIHSNLLKCFGFIKSTDFGYWNHYGEKMFYYHYGYSYISIFSLCDYALFNIINSLHINDCGFNILYCLMFSQVKNSYKSIREILSAFDNDNFNLNNLIRSSEMKRDLNFNAKMMAMYLKIIRNNFSIWGLFIYHYETYKKYSIQDPLITKFLSKEHNNIINIFKQQLVNTIIINGNSVSYSIIKDSIDLSLNILIDNELKEKIIDEITSSTHNKVVQFSIKNDYLHLYDSCNILIPNNESKAEQYIMEFKRNELNILNITKFTYLNILYNIHKEYIKHLCKSNNVEFFINLFMILMKDVQYEYVPLFINVVSKYIMYICLICKEDEKCWKDNYKRMEKVMERIKNVKGKVNDILISNACECLEKMIKEVFLKEKENEIEKNKENIDNGMEVQEKKKDIGIKKKDLMKKYKAKFAKLNTIISEKYTNETTFNTKEDENIKHCVICRCIINANNDNEELSGYFGYVSTSKLIPHILSHRADNILSQYTLSQKPKTSNMISSFILYSCKHYIHYTCYQNLLKQSRLSYRKNLISCPLCKSYNNIFIPFLYNTNTSNSFLLSQTKIFLEKIFDIVSFKHPFSFDKIEFAVDFERFINCGCCYLMFINSEGYFDDAFKEDQIMLLGSIIKALQLLTKENYIKEDNIKQSYSHKCFQIKKMIKYSLEHIIMGGYQNKGIEIEMIEMLFLSIICNDIENQNFSNIMKDYLFNFIICAFIRSIYITNNLQYNKDTFNTTITHDNFIQFCNDNTNNETLTHIINKFNSYYKLSISIYHKITNNNVTSINIPQITIASIIEYSHLHPNIFTTINTITFHDIIPYHLLSLPLNISFSFISLPPNLQDVSRMSSMSLCSMCKKSKGNFYICLLCNDLICKDNCEITFHRYKCYNDYCILMEITNGNVCLIFEGIKIESEYTLYRNKYGEINRNKYYVTNEFYLNEEEYRKLKVKFLTKQI